MKKLALFMLSLAMLCNVQALFGWGATGHDVVAAIAEKHLTDKTKAELGKILDGRSIIYYSSWMDGLQNSPYWKYGYNQTKTWHYANVDEGYTYQTMTKNEKGDVVTGLTMMTDELMNNYANLTDSVKADYVKMIVHMVGDMHCPMHAGRLSDLGGNRTKVRWFGKNTNLHSVWDSKIVESAHSWSYTEWQRQIDRLNRKQSRAIVQGTPNDWIEECVAIADDVYRNSTGTNLSYDYVAQYASVVEQQLLKGGLRLAALIEEIY